nr:hypothetical protein [Tanacetum cinerariifolium]
MVKKVDDMTITEFIEYKERIKRQYNRNSGSYFPTYFSQCTSSNNTTLEFPCNTYFNPIPPNTKFNYDAKDVELDEEVRYTTDEESAISEHEAINPMHTQSFKEELSLKEDLNEWLSVEMEKTHESIYEYLELANLGGAAMLVEMDDMTQQETLGTMRNVLVKINKFEFPWIGEDRIKFDINRNPRQSNIKIEKLYMANTGQEEESFKPLEIGKDIFSCESLACLPFEQDNRNYDNNDPQNEIARQTNPLVDKGGLTKRWHIWKSVHVFYDDRSGDDCGMWPTYDPDSSFCYGYKEVFRKSEQGMLRLW